MSRARRAAAALVAGALALTGLGVGLGQPASAGTASGPYGTLLAPDKTVTGTACVTSVVEFKPAATIAGWTLGVSIDTPSAGQLASFKLTPAAPRKAVSLCPGRNVAGRYDVDAYLSGTRVADDGFVNEPYDAFIDFRVIERKPTALKVSTARSKSADKCPGFEARPKHCWKVAGKLTRAGKPYGWAYVQLQAYARGKWVRQAWSRADGLGRVSWYVTLTRKTESNRKWRLYFPTSDHAKGSVSRTFRLKY